MRTADRDNVLAYLSAKTRGPGMGEENPHRRMAAFELAYGSFFRSQVYDAAAYGKPGKLRECFRNAALLAVKHRIAYVEGHCLSSIGFPVLHAFCVDGEGRVVDPTWTDPLDCLYHGVALDPRRVLRHHASSGYHSSLLDDYPNRWPLVMGAFPLDAWLIEPRCTKGRDNGRSRGGSDYRGEGAPPARAYERRLVGSLGGRNLPGDVRPVEGHEAGYGL